MADASDSDDDDLFADFEKSTCEDLNVSANLISDLGDTAVAQKSLDKRDERADAWVAPAVTGLKNSLTATALQTSGKHWYRDDEFKNKPDSNKTGNRVQWQQTPTPLGMPSTAAGAVGLPGSSPGLAKPSQMGYSPMAPVSIPQMHPSS